MILGVSFPALVLATFEIYYKLTNKISDKYLSYKSLEKEAQREKELLAIEESMESQSNNNFSIRVIGIGIILTGLLVSIFGLMAGNGRILVICVGIFLVLLGFFIRKKGSQNIKTNIEND